MLKQFPNYYDFPTELREDISSDLNEGWLTPVFNGEGKLTRFDYVEMPLFIR